MGADQVRSHDACRRRSPCAACEHPYLGPHLGAWQVRIDVFLTEGQPSNCAINEDSLSSGQNYGPHTQFLNRIWLESWMNKWFLTSQHTGNYTPVYDMLERR